MVVLDDNLLKKAFVYFQCLIANLLLLWLTSCLVKLSIVHGELNTKRKQNAREPSDHRICTLLSLTLAWHILGLVFILYVLIQEPERRREIGVHCGVYLALGLAMPAIRVWCCSCGLIIR